MAVRKGCRLGLAPITSASKEAEHAYDPGRGRGVGALASLCGGAAARAAEKDVENIHSRQYCGMDREKFGSTRMLVEYANGSTIGTCSIHCAAVDLAQSFGKEIKALRVADYRSGKLVDAEKAVWVVGAESRA